MDAVTDSTPPGDEDVGTQVPATTYDKDPPVRPRWKKETATYGQWVRSIPSNRLTKDERRHLTEERDWEKANPKEVVRLEAFVDVVWRLCRDMETLHTEASHAPFRRGTKVHPKGSRIRVFARTGEYLLGRLFDGTVLRLKAEWLEAIPVPVPVPDDTGDEVADAIAKDVTG